MPAWPHPDAFQSMHQAAGQGIQHAKCSLHSTNQGRSLTVQHLLHVVLLMIWPVIHYLWPIACSVAALLHWLGASLCAFWNSKNLHMVWLLAALLVFHLHATLSFVAAVCGGF